MLHSSLVGRGVKLCCIWQNKGSISTPQIIVNKAVKLNYLTFPTTSMEISPNLHRKSEFLKPLQIRLHSLRSDILHSQFRYFSDNENPPLPNPAEENLVNILKESFPSATDIAVVDISGGCGSMYEVFVESPDFKGMRLVKQHKMVTEALKGEIKDMHGLRISTVVPE